MDGALDFCCETAKIEVRVHSCAKFILGDPRPIASISTGAVSLLRHESTKNGNAPTEKKVAAPEINNCPAVPPQNPSST